MSSDERFLATITLICLSVLWLSTCGLHASREGFHYAKRPLVVWGYWHRTAAYEVWIPTVYAISKKGTIPKP